MPFEAPILAAVPAVFNFAVKGTQTSFELQQVPEQTRALFETIESTRSDIINARERRVALAKQYGSEGFAEWDRSVKETEAALTDLEKLVESARIDLQHNDGKIGMKTRFTWVLRDSKSLSATSHRLTLAHQRMLFAMTIVHIKHDRERSENSYSFGTSPAPPPYANHNNVLRKLSDVRRSIDQGRLARPRSTSSSIEGEGPTRPLPTTRRTVIPVPDHEEDFNDLRHERRQTRARPSVDSLNPIVATAEARNSGNAAVFPSVRNTPAQTDPAVSARAANSNPSRPFIDIARLQAARVNRAELQQQVTKSPPITPPASPYPRPVDAPFLNTPAIRHPVEEQVGMAPALNETASIRFELDAAQEIRTSAAYEPLQGIPRKSLPVPGARTTSTIPAALRAPTSQAKKTLLLPYPDDGPPERHPLRISPQRSTPTPNATPSTTIRSTTSSRSTSHSFAGHRQPFNIRWNSEPDEVSRDKSAQQPEAPPRQPKVNHHDVTAGYVYQPYRPK